MSISPAPVKTPITSEAISGVWGSWFDRLYQRILRVIPWRITQSTEPVIETPAIHGIKKGELMIWHDSDDDKTYLMYADILNDNSVVVRKVELT